MERKMMGNKKKTMENKEKWWEEIEMMGNTEKDEKWMKMVGNKEKKMGTEERWRELKIKWREIRKKSNGK